MISGNSIQKRAANIEMHIASHPSMIDGFADDL